MFGMTTCLSHIVLLAAVHGALRDVADEVARHGYVVLFVLIAAESFGFPLPGEISLLVGAYEVQRGAFALPAVVLVGAVAAVAGDNAAYLLGRKAGRPWSSACSTGCACRPATSIGWTPTFAVMPASRW